MSPAWQSFAEPLINRFHDLSNPSYVAQLEVASLAMARDDIAFASISQGAVTELDSHATAKVSKP
jgi:hypothetical protein